MPNCFAFFSQLTESLKTSSSSSYHNNLLPLESLDKSGVKMSREWTHISDGVYHTNLLLLYDFFFTSSSSSSLSFLYLNIPFFRSQFQLNFLQPPPQHLNFMINSSIAAILDPKITAEEESSPPALSLIGVRGPRTIHFAFAPYSRVEIVLCISFGSGLAQKPAMSTSINRPPTVGTSRMTYAEPQTKPFPLGQPRPNPPPPPPLLDKRSYISSL
ncbi:hypothetical protein F8388_004150 [Cannabis sativa]|uniref:Uncharacterized protein n=1 Tax=Cannabis sativa TaxID=3483 RepID=A0A7J6E6U6_CANSA|nr:hypothetical protein F8388_004150 [Cannabis sativa]